MSAKNNRKQPAWLCKMFLSCSSLNDFPNKVNGGQARNRINATPAVTTGKKAALSLGRALA